MTVCRILILVLCALITSACRISYGTSSDSTALYELEFITHWSAANFSTNFPTNRHFSGLIGLTHNSDIKIFEVGSLASSGIVSMAETGSKSLLKTEIEDFQNRGQSGSTIDGLGIPSTSNFVSVIFEVSRDHPLVSVVSMIAPSPDWFTGINSVPLYSDGQWVEQIDISVIAYDAGSDSGVTFRSNNLATIPRTSITKLSSSRADTDFQNGVHFSSLLSIGRFTLTKK